MKHFDAIVIGTGQAGPPLAGRLTKAGMKVAIAERKLFGGTCVNTGCIPTKALVASAYAVRMARRAAEYGIRIEGDIQVDMKAVKARKDAISGESRTGVETWLKAMENCTVYEGHARLESARVVSIGEERISADKIFINTGGRAATPPLPGLDEISYLTNVSMLDLDHVPERLVIVGGSYIALEFGQMYRRFGSDVTIIEKRNRLIPREDEDVSAALKDILENEGVHLRLEAECIGFARKDGQIAVHAECSTDSSPSMASHVLLAVGRRPNTDDLGLDRAGVKMDRHGYIEVDDELGTNVAGIWALGDCNGKGAFTHTSYNDFEIVAANLLDDDILNKAPRRVSDRITAYGVYTDPPLGRAGMTEAQVRESGKPALIATRPMTKVGRAVEKGESQGFMKVMVDAESKRILGASILGTGGDEAIHCILDVMYAKAPYTTIQRAVHIHPTVSELIPTMLADLRPLA